MLTYADVQEKIVKTVETIDELKQVKSSTLDEAKKISRRVNQLKAQYRLDVQVARYLKTEPREEFVKKQLGDNFSKMKKLDASFIPPDWGENEPLNKEKIVAKMKADYLKDNGMPKLKSFERTLKYILNGSVPKIAEKVQAPN